MDSPYQWTKQVASHWGGTRNGTIVHWPKGIKEKGGMRNQFSHVIDVAPTVLEAAGLPEPTTVNGVQQSPYEGTSMLYSFNDANAAERHETQYFEMFCNRGIYHKGWSAVTKHRTPWEMGGAKLPAFDDDVWELYDGNNDWTQAHDLSKKMPEKLHALQRLWLIEAVKYNVLPLDDRQIERFVPELAGRPALIKGNSQLLFAGMGRLSENSVVSIKNKSFAVTADIEVPGKGAEGVFIAQGGRFGGWSLYAKAARPSSSTTCLASSRSPSKARTHSGRQDAGARGVRLRRRRQWQRWQRNPLFRRQRGWQGSRRADPGVRVFGGRDHRYRIRVGHHGQPRLHRPHQPVQRQDSLGADRSRQGRPGRRPLHLARGAPPRRHGAAVATEATGADLPCRWLLPHSSEMSLTACGDRRRRESLTDRANFSNILPSSTHHRLA